MENLNLELSAHFSLKEFWVSSTARKLNIVNIPNKEVIDNLAYGVKYILEPLRLEFGSPIIINSGYRSERLNKAVGGVSNSYHLKGCAADIRLDSNDHASMIFNILKKNPYVDVCLFEHAGTSIWIHVQWRPEGNPRNHFNYNFKANVL